jgi:hypothetical protein
MAMHVTRLAGILLLTSTAVLLSGCTRLGAMSRADPTTIAVYTGAAYRPPSRVATAVDINSRNGCVLVRAPNDFHVGAINLDCFRFPEDWSRDPTSGEASSDHYGQSTPLRPWLAYARAASDRTARNRLTQILMKHSDDVCTVEMGRITSNQATVNASLNILSTAATTTANIVTGQASEILTGVGTFATASRSHMNADVYRNTVAYAISRAITLERERLREQIQNRQAQDHENYTIDEAIRAVNQYHGVCSFYKGLELVLASVEGDQRTREREARRAQIDELQNQVRLFQEARQAAGPETDLGKAYQVRINALLDRIQALTLAAVPDPVRVQNNDQKGNERQNGDDHQDGGEQAADGTPG